MNTTVTEESMISVRAIRHWTFSFYRYIRYMIVILDIKEVIIPFSFNPRCNDLNSSSTHNTFKPRTSQINL